MPAEAPSRNILYVDTENHQLINNFVWTSVIHYDDVKDTLVPYNSGFYYQGGEYGPEGVYYYSSVQDRETGRLVHASQGGLPNSGVSASSDGADSGSFAAAAASYESGTATPNPATGSAYVSPTASATVESTPATSDATSLAGVAAAAVSALGVLGLGKAIRRK